MSDAIVLLALGMGTVFILLFAINMVIVVLGKLLGPKGQAAPADTKAPKSASAAEGALSQDEDEEQLVALFAAAAAAYLGTDPKRIQLVVQPVKTSEVWAQVGRMENSL